MRRLFEIDLKDYKETDNVFRRPSARAIIRKGDKIALVYSKKEKYYKFPGGGIRDDEDKIKALIREVREEVGMVVIPESIREFGSVLRRQKSDRGENTIFEQENFYYLCDVQDELVEQELDDYESDAEFVLRVVDFDTAIKANDIYTSDVFFNEVMIKRDLRVLRLLKMSERQIDDEIRLIPYYRNDEVSLAWYQDHNVCKQVDNRDEPYDQELLHRMYDFLSTHGDCYYIEYENALVGDVSLRDNGEVAIVVCKEYQNRHIGRRCIEEIIKLAKEKDIKTIKANIYSFNSQSRKMFETVGFKETEDEWYEYSLKD
jgi:8-oxo-dGTP pyrophosphatase MutT (NUDIX family)/N-acetylglutamate synthase-like GNAT family acetyltransferase